jgi:hypothetical protein
MHMIIVPRSAIKGKVKFPSYTLDENATINIQHKKKSKLNVWWIAKVSQLSFSKVLRIQRLILKLLVATLATRYPLN